MSADKLSTTDEMEIALNEAPIICELCKAEIKETNLAEHWSQCVYFKREDTANA